MAREPNRSAPTQPLRSSFQRTRVLGITVVVVMLALTLLSILAGAGASADVGSLQAEQAAARDMQLSMIAQRDAIATYSQSPGAPSLAAYLQGRQDARRTGESLRRTAVGRSTATQAAAVLAAA